jgi:hypothetical protein
MVKLGQAPPRNASSGPCGRDLTIRSQMRNPTIRRE